MSTEGADVAAGGQEAERATAASRAASAAELVRRMECVARARGVDLGEVRAVSGSHSDVEVGAGRGKIVVSPRAGDAFHVRICLHRVLAWSEGWAGGLAAVVAVADLWRRGCRLRELCDRFPFMSWSELAQAFEDGDPAPARWRQLLADDLHAVDRPFLRAAHAHGELRLCYPDLSHGSLMLSRRPFDPAAGLVRITPLPGGRYEVAVRLVGFPRVVPSLNEALEVTAAWFRSSARS